MSTGRHGDLPYDHLVLALGVRAEPAVPGALTFRGPQDAPPVAAALRATGLRRVAFVAAAGAGWTLPLYELALMTAAWSRRRERPVEVLLASPERSPLDMFGSRAGTEVATLLAEAHVPRPLPRGRGTPRARRHPRLTH